MTLPSCLRVPLLLVALAATSCSSSDATQLVLAVDTDLSIPDAVDSIQLTVTGPGGMRQTADVDLTTGAVRPLTLGLRPTAMAIAEGTLGPVEIIATAELAGSPVVERRVVTAFVSGSSLLLEILLSERCRGVACGADESCDGAVCVPAAIPAQSLPDFTGSIPNARSAVDGSVADACAPSPETCNGLDDDCDGVVDNGIDLSTSATDCGSCGHACGELTGVETGACSGGGCVVTCRSGFDDCDGDPDNGCEANLDVEVANCSGCGMACDFANGAGTCAGGTCALSECEAGFADCDADGRNGCEVDLTTAANCGRCGHDCGATACEASGFCEGENAIGLATGSQHTCALRANGQMSCWGLGTRGQLGTGAMASTRSPVPVMSMPAGATRITLGGNQTCVVATGQGLCWGDNAGAQLGDGTRTNRSTPTPLSLPRAATVIRFAQGSGHGCAIVEVFAGRRLRCWGTNRDGQVGQGSVMDQLVPVDVDDASFGASRPVTLAAGARHSCAVLDDGRAYCWGDGSDGQLGGGGTADVQRPSPVEVALGTALDLSNGVDPVSAEDVSIVAGAAFTCALDVAGQVHCWGDNSRGQVGDASVVSRRTLAVPVTGLDDAIALAAGDAHVCALRRDGRVSCWGANGFGQLGDGTTGERNTPVDVLDAPADIAEIACGASHLCMRTTAGAVHCLGRNSVGQLGDGTIADRASPTAVATLP